MAKVTRLIFWFAWSLTHAASAAGSILGGWLAGIASDGTMLLAIFDGLLFVFFAVLALRGAPCKKSTWASFAGFAGLGLFFALSPGVGPWIKEPGQGGAAGLEFTLMQGNTEGKGNPGGWGADVVVLSELWDAALLAPAGLLLAVGPKPGVNDTAIYSRFEAESSGLIQSDKSGWSQAAWAKLKTPGGPVMVVSVHTHSPTSFQWDKDRNVFFERLALFLAEQPKSMPVVVSGDFNATPANLAFRRLLSKADFAQEPNPWSPTWHSAAARFGLGFRIDRTMGINGARIKSWRALAKGPSDHLFSESKIAVEFH